MASFSHQQEEPLEHVIFQRGVTEVFSGFLSSPFASGGCTDTFLDVLMLGCGRDGSPLFGAPPTEEPSP